MSKVSPINQPAVPSTQQLADKSAKSKQIDLGEEIIISKLDPGGIKSALGKLALSIGTNHVFKIFKANGKPVIYDSFRYVGEGEKEGDYPTLRLIDDDDNEITFFTHIENSYRIRRVK